MLVLNILYSELYVSAMLIEVGRRLPKACWFRFVVDLGSNNAILIGLIFGISGQ